MALFNALKSEEKVIRILWNHDQKHWTYKYLQSSNKIPFVIFGFKGYFKTQAMNEIYADGPQLGNPRPYPFVNHLHDTLFFDMPRCGNRLEDLNEYVEALDQAAEALRSTDENQVRRIRLTFCTQIGYMAEILDKFNNIEGLLYVEIYCHDHTPIAAESWLDNYWMQTERAREWKQIDVRRNYYHLFLKHANFEFLIGRPS